MAEVTPRLATVKTCLADGVLLLRGVSGSESLGRLFAYELDLIGTADDISLDEVLGSTMTITMPVLGGSERFLNGIVTRFERLAARDPAGRASSYRATLQPTLWLLSQTSDCRVFQNMSAVEIVKKLCNEHGVTDLEDSLTSTYRSLEFVVQYRETALNFISRLMEQEGIYYYFRHSDGGHTLVLADATSAHAPVSNYEEIPYRASVSPEEGSEALYTWSARHSLLPDRYALNDFDYLRPNADLQAEMTAAAQTDRSLEMYDYPGEYLQTADGEAYASVRLQELHAEREVFTARGNVRGLCTGALFTLTGGPQDGLELLVTQASLAIEVGDLGVGERSASHGFTVSATVMPSTTPFRPARRSARPIIAGPQTATVVGGAGDEIFTDAHGRIKVLFHWDRRGKAQGNENTSCWIRVAQLWAGAGFGALHLPRVGQEVIVEFLEGDPDRPIVTGRVYNGAQTPPFPLPGSRTQSGIRSRSSKGGGPENCNELRFEDKKGDEHVFLQAEKDLIVNVKNDEADAVGNNRSRTVGVNEDVSVGANRSLTVGENQTTDVGANRSLTIGGSENVTIGVMGMRSVGGAQAVNIGTAYTLTVGTAIAESCELKSIQVGSDESHRIGKSHSLSIGQADSVSVGKGRKTKVGDDDQLEVGKKLVLQAGKEIQLVTGKAKLTLKSDGKILLEGTEIVIKSSGKTTVKASGDLTLKGSKVKGN